MKTFLKTVPDAICSMVLWFGCGLPTSAIAQAPKPFTPQQFGAVADFHELTGIVLKAGSPEIAAHSPSFSMLDVGKAIFFFGAGTIGGHQALVTTVTAVSQDGRTATLAASSRATLEASGGIGTDDAAPLQSCWDASSKLGSPCFMPTGRYLFSASPLTLHPHTRAEGNAPEQTSLVCSPMQRDCIVLGDGPIQFVTLDSWELAGTEASLPPPATNQNAQRGIVLRARGTGGAGGGLWQSSFRHLQIASFWGDELALIGGHGEAQHPNQFLFFEDIELQTARGDGTQQPPKDSYRLRLEGQNAQILFLGGQIHGTIAGQFGNGALVDGAGVVRFDGVTCEWLDRCLIIPSATTINFSHGWIENVKQVVSTGPHLVRGVFLDQNYLANACFDLHDHSGFCFHAANPDSQDLAFTQNQLAWGTAPPDAVLLSPPTTPIQASGNNVNGKVFDLAPSQRSLRSETNNSSLRQGHILSPWIPALGHGEAVIAWLPQAFPTADVTASCVTVGGEGELTVVGIDQLSPTEVHVHLENRSSTHPLRAVIHCIGVIKLPTRDGGEKRP